MKKGEKEKGEKKEKRKAKHSTALRHANLMNFGNRFAILFKVE